MFTRILRMVSPIPEYDELLGALDEEETVASTVRGGGVERAVLPIADDDDSAQIGCAGCVKHTGGTQLAPVTDKAGADVDDLSQWNGLYVSRETEKPAERVPGGRNYWTVEIRPRIC
jgi:hypothetical protein